MAEREVAFLEHRATTLDRDFERDSADRSEQAFLQALRAHIRRLRGLGNRLWRFPPTDRPLEGSCGHE